MRRRESLVKLRQLQIIKSGHRRWEDYPGFKQMQAEFESSSKKQQQTTNNSLDLLFVHTVCEGMDHNSCSPLAQLIQVVHDGEQHRVDRTVNSPIDLIAMITLLECPILPNVLKKLFENKDKNQTKL
jgi:hypothetical protein